MSMSKLEKQTRNLASKAIDTAVRHLNVPDEVSYGDAVNADIQLLQAHLQGGKMDPDSARRAEKTIFMLRRGAREFGRKTWGH